MRRLHAALLLAVLAVCSTLQSRAQVRGEVLDTAYEPISRATIRVLDGQSRKEMESIRTDAAARFELPALAPGRYVISFSSPGFSPELIELDTTKSGANRDRTIRLNPRDCDAPGENCDCFAQCPAFDPHPIAAQASLKIGLADAIDLDKGVLVPLASPDAGLSLLEKDGGLFLNSLNGAALLNACKPQYGRNRQKTQTPPFRVDGLDRDMEVCMTTKRGRFSKIFLTRQVNAGDKQVLVYVSTREK